jgi:hypothetical protein
MAQQYDNTNTIALFMNDKGGNEKRPDYRGKINVNGTEYAVSAWLQTKKDGSGEQYLRGKIEPWKGAEQAPRTGGTPSAFPKREAPMPTPARRAEENTEDTPF